MGEGKGLAIERQRHQRAGLVGDALHHGAVQPAPASAAAARARRSVRRPACRPARRWCRRRRRRLTAAISAASKSVVRAEAVQHRLHGVDHVAAGAAGVGLEAEGRLRGDEALDALRAARPRRRRRAARAAAGRCRARRRRTAGGGASRAPARWPRARRPRRRPAWPAPPAGCASARRCRRRPRCGGAAQAAVAAGSAGCRAGRCCRSPPACRATRRGRPRRSARVSKGRPSRAPRSSASPSARLMVVSSVTCPGAQLEPAAADDVPVHAALRGEAVRDLARRHELDGGAERVADGQAEVGAQRAVQQRARASVIARLDLVVAADAPAPRPRRAARWC